MLLRFTSHWGGYGLLPPPTVPVARCPRKQHVAASGSARPVGGQEAPETACCGRVSDGAPLHTHTDTHINTHTQTHTHTHKRERDQKPTMSSSVLHGAGLWLVQADERISYNFEKI